MIELGGVLGDGMTESSAPSPTVTWLAAARTAGQLSGRVMPPRPMPETMTLVMNQVMP